MRRSARALTGRAARAFAAALAAVAMAHLPAAFAAPVAATGTVEFAFTPDDAVDARIVAVVNAAEREVLVLAYSFTHPKIARALTAAYRRGVRVEVIADRGQTQELPQSVVPALARDGVPVWLDGSVAAAHNKVLIVDADGAHPTSITGSYNFTLAAQKKNAENIVILRDNPEAAAAYRAYFRRRQAHAVRWSGDGPPPEPKPRRAR